MPAIFYREAFEAAAGEKTLHGIGDEHFTNWEKLAEALDRLRPEQLCDAVYADWLLQLHDPAHQALLQIRNLLIGQGALAANYLAELAQNADDAADEQQAQIRVVLDEDWLFVSNNGRKVTSLNLLGLCRFFVHAAGQIRELNEETIGRFGIGFKSSYRIASEVVVQTWDPDGSFSFRLPICREEDPASHPDTDRLKSLVNRLSVGRFTGLETTVRDVNSLGYCTPEFLSALPATLAGRTTALRQTPRVTIFCFHVRPDRLDEVKRRISGQAHEVYELCPLFLPNLRLVQLGPNQLTMQMGWHDKAKDLVGDVEADKVTLSTGATGQLQSHSRFWRLRGVADGDLWQAALHADSQHRLRLDREADERGVTLKDGAAYAFFPLNVVNWPFRFHLHVKLPTNLARDNWNPADAVAVEEQIRRGVRGVARWLDARLDELAHANWGFERLVEQRPSPMRNEGDWPAKWANVVFEELKQAAHHRTLLRDIFGRRSPANGGQTVILLRRPTVDEACDRLSKQTCLPPDVGRFLRAESGVFQFTEARPSDVEETFKALLIRDEVPVRVRQDILLVCLAIQSHSSSSLEHLLGPLAVERHDGRQAKLEELMYAPAGTELLPSWHETFRQLESWAQECAWRYAHVFGERLEAQLRKLAQPQFNPTWSELSARLADEAAWRQHGETFWKTQRQACPPESFASALSYLRVPDGLGGWLTITDLWLDDDTPVQCFGELLKPWPLSYNDARRKRITAFLNDWGIFVEWERSAKQRLAEKLPGVLAIRLTEKAAQDAFGLVFDEAFENSRRTLDGGWKHLVAEAEKTAVGRFVQARANEESLTGKTILSASIPASVRAALCLADAFVSAPPWLTDTAHQRVCRLGLQEKLDFEFLSRRDFVRRAEELGQIVLDTFHQWQQVEPTDLLLQGLEDVFGSVGVQRRRDLFIALSTQRRRRVREFFAALSTADADSSPAEKLMAARLSRAVKQVDPLPSPLDRVAALAEVAVHFGKLRCERETGSEVLLQNEQVNAAVGQDANLMALVDQKLPLYGASQGLRLKWCYGEETVAELNDADVGWFGDRLVFGHYTKPVSEEQYVRLLSLYELSDVVSDDYRKAQRRGASPFDLYQEFRDHIVDVLLKKHVKEVGYTKEHVLRELLQNAESAYASKQIRLSVPWFEFRIEAGARLNDRVIHVRHAGRAFNEPDRDGKPRPDVERIVKINAPNQNTEQELGRFNRGFKSVFIVAKDGKVRIRTGSFSFEILDLLLLNPAEPRPDQPPQTETEFEFIASKDDALGLIGFKSVPTGKAPPELLNSTSLIFLSQLRRVTIRWEDKSWDWHITWTHLRHGWIRVDVAETTSVKAEAFWVYSGRLADTRLFGIAIRLGKDGAPKLLEKEWRTLRLTFETECAFGFDVLINGDFEADQGRVNLRGLSASGADIIEAALNAALDRTRSELGDLFSKQVWVAWAKVLHLKDAREVFEAGFRDSPKRFERWVERLEEQMTNRVPCSSGQLALDRVTFPTRLMRRLAMDFAKRWGIDTQNWIEHEADEELPAHIRDHGTKFSLPKWLSEMPPMTMVLQVLQADFRQPAFETLKRSLGKPERDELAVAERILEEKLRPVAPLAISEPQLPEVEAWTVKDLWLWWNRPRTHITDDKLGTSTLWPTSRSQSRREQSIAEYTLEGIENWRLLYSEILDDAEARRQRIRSDLQAAKTPASKRIWYRLLGLACLMSAGRRVTELRTFWQSELDTRGFWESTSGTAFGKGTDMLFDDLLRRRFGNFVASGEHAYFWRRIFYDLRKIHKLVWEDDFPATLLELVGAGHGGNLLNFLKTGHLPGQRAWIGVFGQSAGAPLFFLVRELCRLGVIKDAAVQPLAFFISTPVRRAMERIGWLESDLSNRVDFESLAAISEQLHQKFISDREFGSKLLPDYDIPLLHLGLES